MSALLGFDLPPGLLWYTTRATGMVSLALLTGAMVLGMANAARFRRPGRPRFVLAAIHRNVSLLSVVFLAVHVGTAIVDPFAPIGWASAIVPFTSAYRPVWLGLGTVAFDLVLALAVTSLLRLRLGFRTWRAVHWLAYLCWPVALFHALGTGSDTRLTVALVLGGLCVAAVVGAVWWRLARSGPGRARLRGAAAMAAAILPVTVAGFLVAGPFQPGWARRAGTPPSLLAPVTQAPAAVVDVAAGDRPSGIAESPRITRPVTDEDDEPDEEDR